MIVWLLFCCDHAPAVFSTAAAAGCSGAARIRPLAALTARQGKFPHLLFNNHVCYDLTVFGLVIPDIDPSHDQVIADE